MISEWRNKVIQGDCLELMKKLPDNSIDLIVTDPPYGLKFMGKDWDKAVPSVSVWVECLRVLKPGAFAFIMTSPRSDLQAEMIKRLEKAGFETGFTPIYWAYATGFPKSMNISKAIDKKKGLKRSGIIRTDGVHSDSGSGCYNLNSGNSKLKSKYETGEPISKEAKALDGSYAGFQPKPAVEVILVVMKPLSEKNYVNQALSNGKGVTWLDDCRIPYESNDKVWKAKNAIIDTSIGAGKMGLMTAHSLHKGKKADRYEAVGNPNGRFPANLLVSDDVLNDGKVTVSQGGKTQRNTAHFGNTIFNMHGYGDVGSFSRYFSLDAWWEEFKRVHDDTGNLLNTFPFAIIPKASKNEKNKGLENDKEKPKCKNFHPTVKPVKLMSYLITLGSRANDLILDPFMGSGTTGVSAVLCGRDFIGFELNPEYCEIARKRIKAIPRKLNNWSVGD